MLEFNQAKKRRYRNRLYRKKVAGIKVRVIFCLKIMLALSVIPAVSLICIFGYDCLTQSDYFRAETITVEGNQILSEEEVIKETLVKPGDNILSVNLSMVRKRLMANTWIAEAEVVRKIPSGIIVRIKEHKPLAVLDLGKEFLLNDHGDIFKEKTTTDPENLPLVKGLKFSDLSLSGARRSPSFNAVMTVLKLGRKPESILPNSSITLINVDRDIGLTVFAFDKTIQLGYNNYPDKYERLEKVFYHAKNGRDFSDFETVDLNNLGRIVIRPAANPAEEPEEYKKEV
ncbi:MAG: FtsQ-type POTRA domain-containing protein [Proteobacteria bacterium]|nr:FtsQ-type POTRA domain-containing protein [Pseudomonadota bacterium]MBU1571116.1 FtsQ-type POTRA domain-containing protein [Pseudomonadota bacterium]